MKPNLLLALRKRFCLALMIIIGGISFYTCIDDKYNLEKISKAYKIDPLAFLPLGSLDFTIDTILNHLDSSQYIHKTDSGLIYILYEKNLEFYKGEDKFIIPSHNIWNVSLPPLGVGVFPPSGNITVSIDTFHIPVSFGPDQLIDSMSIKKLLLSTSVHSTYGHPSTLHYTFPNLVKNKTPFIQTYRITAGNFSESQNSDAVGYFLKFSNVAPGISYINVKVDLTMTGAAGSAVGPGSIDMGITTDSLKYYALYGYAGQKELLGVSDSMNLSFLNNYITNKIEWKNPMLTVSVNNSYIILPIRLTADSMLVYSKIDNQTYHVTVDPNPVEIPYPKHIGDLNIDTTITYTKVKNLNLYHAIESVPEYLKFHFRALANPDKITSLENIIIDTSSIKVKAIFNLPLWFRSGGFGTSDTMDFNMEKIAGKGLDSIQYLLFRVISENGMPVDMNLQVYFVDSTGATRDSMFKSKNPQILIAGALGPDDRVISPTWNMLQSEFKSVDELKIIKDTKKLRIKVFLNTADWNATNGRYVKFFSDYKFKLSIAFRFHGKFSGYF